MNFFKRGTFVIPADYEKILLVLFGLWLIFSFMTRKFDKSNFQTYYYALAACIKSAVFMGASLSLVIFAYRLFFFSRAHLFGALLLFFFGEIFLYYIYYSFKLGKNFQRDIESSKEILNYLEQKELPICERTQEEESLAFPSFMKILYERCLKAFPQLFKFVSNNIDLSEIRDSEVAIMSSSDIINVEILSSRSLRLLINLHRLNDIRWINRCFLAIHKQLDNGGYFIGRANTIEVDRRRFIKKYPSNYAKIFYLLHFIFYRIFPKLSLTKKAYFFITKGRGRVISRAEILGRLYFCGFKVIAEQELGESLFFIAQKAKTPSLDLSPTYGPIVKLRRMGLNGQPIQIYKFRTMYPYSEYLQEYIYQRHNLREGGKIRDDFRVTEWGKIMRKYWIDELPMIYNWIKGEIKLFGVRPLSKHYLSLYDRHLRRIRKKVKPGLIPPFYADLPEKFEEIKESERRYIQSYCKNPLKTQIIYFWKALNNIIFKGVRTN